MPLEAVPASRRAFLAAALAAALPGRAAARQDTLDPATDLLRRGAEAMAEVRSFHFSLTTPQGRTQILNALALRAIEGDVLRPDRFRARIEASAAGLLDLTVTVIGIADRMWISDPRHGNATWIETGGEGGASGGDALAVIANPDLLFLAALSVLSEPVSGPEGVIDGEPVRRIDGIVDLQRIAAEAGAFTGEHGTPPPGMIPDPLPVSVWFGGGDRPRRIELEGPLFPGDDANVIRRLDLTRFDQPVTIEPPVSATPLAGA
jgi:hypothetical protein